MKFHHLFLFIILSFGRGNAGTSSLVSSRLADMLQDFCPGANVCRGNQTIPPPFRSGFVSCCDECSCEPGCEDDGNNCCFPNSGPTVQQSDNQASQMGEECLFPTTIQPPVKDRIHFQSYRMISSVPKVSVDIASTTNLSCGDVNVAPWGSLYPVYATESERWYKNKACAAADGEEDVIPWDAILVCSDYADGIELDASSFVLGLDSNSIHDSCRVDFIFQGDNEYIQPVKCYDDLIDTCNAQEFQMPDAIGVSKESIIEACTSGLVSPFRAIDLYANVFCHICNAEEFWNDMACREPIDFTDRGFQEGGFIGLLDRNFIRKNRQEDIKGESKYPRACPIKAAKNQQVCLTVFCPSGQLRDRAGNCRYPNNLWYDQEYTVFINLTLEKAINISEVFQINPGEISDTLPDFESPWQNNWFVESILYEDDDQCKNVTKLAVVVKNKTPKVKPNQFVKNIKKLVNRDWFLRHNNSTLVLKSSILKFRYTIFRNHEDTESRILIGNQSESILKPRYRWVYKLFKIPGNMLLITKLYMCDQVELSQADFILSLDQTVLLNTITTRLLFEGEFALITSSTFAGVRARVCVEDSGLYRTDRVVLSYGCSLYKAYAVWLFVAAVIFWEVAY